MELGAADLQVWSVRLIASDATVAAYEQILSASEVERGRRFYHVAQRRAYALSHGVLRFLLGRYLRTDPRQIEFCYGRAGKPALEGTPALVQFNMSHSGDLAVYAFAGRCQLGVDVEQVRPLPDLELVASHFFSEQECADVLALNGVERTEAFFRCWTRKEAYIKAVGDGLSMPLKSFRVSVAAGQPAALLHTAQASGRLWQMHHLRPDADYVGAVVYEGSVRTIREWPLMDAGQVLNP